MSNYYIKLAEKIRERLGTKITDCVVAFGEVTVIVNKDNLLEACEILRDDPVLHCEELMDVAGIDYQDYSEGNWEGPRFAVAYQLLSISNNHRIRVKAFTDGEPPVIDSVIGIWASANWFEREAFDLFGIVFEGHPDLRRILTDYGFVGHPFRKDFPLIGKVEMRYDPEQRRVIYQPVSIEPRINQVRIIRDDHRYADRDDVLTGSGDSNA